MRRTAPITFFIAAAFWFGIAAFLAGVMLLADIKGRPFPTVLPIAAAIVAIVGLRFLLWARHASARRK
jgi:hypothetical protein